MRHLLFATALALAMAVSPAAAQFEAPECVTVAEKRAEAITRANEVGLMNIRFHTVVGSDLIDLMAYYNAMPPASNAEADLAFAVRPGNGNVYILFFVDGCQAQYPGLMLPEILFDGFVRTTYGIPA